MSPHTSFFIGPLIFFKLTFASIKRKIAFQNNCHKIIYYNLLKLIYNFHIISMQFIELKCGMGIDVSGLSYLRYPMGCSVSSMTLGSGMV